MNAETQTQLLRLDRERVAATKRRAELGADVFALAARFARDGEGDVGEEIASALEECMKAYDVVQRYLVGVERRKRELRGQDPVQVDVGDVSVRLHEERAVWLSSTRSWLLQEAAKVHREAEIARRAGRVEAARRLLRAKDRFEFVAGALGDVVAHEYDGDG